MTVEWPRLLGLPVGARRRRHGSWAALAEPAGGVTAPASCVRLLVEGGLCAVGVATLPQETWNGLTSARGVWLFALRGGRVYADGAQLPCVPCAWADTWSVATGDYVVVRHVDGVLSVRVNGGEDTEVCRVPLPGRGPALRWVVCLYRGDSVRVVDVAPQARWLLLCRALCLEGRAHVSRDAPAPGGPARFLCTVAPLWLFQSVCALLRDF